MERFAWICCIPLVLFLLAVDPGMASIDCYVCNSHNYSDPHCDDPMSPAFMQLKENCMVPKENHIGKFPANFCVKMIGTSIETGEHLVIRTCVLEDMNNQCGTFRFANETYTGCILTCDFDGCNAAIHLIPVSKIFILIISVLIHTAL
eukprot:14722.XXX_469035_469619_1 [CDS] Oithona nana genome sequencing.